MDINAVLVEWHDMSQDRYWYDGIVPYHWIARVYPDITHADGFTMGDFRFLIEPDCYIDR